MSASLQGLPAELLDRIAHYVSQGGWKGLRNLRLACREIQAKTFFRFGSTYFKSINVSIRPGGFHRLSKICEHPQLRSHVRDLHLDAGPFISWEEDGYSPGDSESDIDIDPEYSVQFNQIVLAFVYEGSLARQLDKCVADLPHLECLRLWQPIIDGDLSRHEARHFRRAWSAVIKSSLYIIRRHRVHLKMFSILDGNALQCPPDIGVLDPITRSPELFGSLTDLRLGINIADADGK